MKRQRVSLIAILAIVGFLWFAYPCCAENQALKEECETKALKASQRIESLGPERAYKEITDPDGPFVGSTSHVFCIDSENGAVLAHKTPHFVGFDMHAYKAADDRAPYVEILEKAKHTQSGWIRYMSYGTGSDRRETPGLKNMYFLKVSSENIVVCCGYWDTD